LWDLNAAGERVASGRKFLRGYEDPSSSAKANKLYRQFQKNETYLSTLTDTIGLYESLESGIYGISKSAEDAYISVLEVLNAPRSDVDSRAIYAGQLRSLQASIVMDMNAKFGDRFIYAGSATKELPFEMRGGKLYFRGIDVETTDPAELDLLAAMANEEKYVDLGFGMEIDNTAPRPNTLVPGSAFDTTWSGLKVLGYGEGNNLACTIGRLADALESEPYDRDVVVGGGGGADVGVHLHAPGFAEVALAHADDEFFAAFGSGGSGGGGVHEGEEEEGECECD